jgi:flagellar motor protein MotB
MRIFITVLSIIFFILACIVTFKAAMLPDAYMGYMPADKYSQSHEEAGSAFARSAKSSHTDREMAVATKSGIAEDSSSGTVKEEIPPQQNVASIPSSRKPSAPEPRILAVIGGEKTFRSGQIVLSESVMNTINRLVKDINDSPGSRVIIEGHTDNVPIRAARGSRYYDNMELSFLRAKAVADLLVKNGIARERISVTGYGDTRPVDTNETREGRAKNRRVVVRLVSGTGAY